jgi:CheY-like chemotaxis protein
MLRKKPFYSTTDVAKICNVHRNTIILAIKKGDLKASSTPGGHNRVAHRDLVRFIRERDLPVLCIPGEDDEDLALDGNLPPTIKQRILIVDDDPTMVKMIEATLAEQGYEVLSAHNGYDAGRMTELHRPDLILLDYMLPDIDGGKVYRSLQQREETRRIRFVVITSFGDIEQLEAQFGPGIPLLRKPFSTEMLKAIVAKSLNEPEQRFSPA